MGLPSAFCSSSYLFPSSSYNTHRSALSLRRQHALPSPPRRRPRRAPVNAVFIWTNDFAEDQPEDQPEDHPEDHPEHHSEHHDHDEHDPDHDEHDQQSDPHFFQLSDHSWHRIRRPTDQPPPQPSSFTPPQSRSHPDAAHPHHSNSSSAPSSQHPSHNSHHHNPLFVAIRTYTQGPDDIDRLRPLVSDGAADSFHHIVNAVLGTMPSDVYEVIITTDRSGMSRLMHSSLCTGYALRNAEFRMLLNDTMHTFKSPTAAEPNSQDKPSSTTVRDLFSADISSNRENAPTRARSDTSRAKGVVTSWDPEQQAKRELSAAEYIAKLEAENDLLRERLTAAQMNDANRSKLMAFVRTLTPQKLLDLQASLGEEALDAFRSVIKSVLGEFNVTKMQLTYSTTRDYMAHVTFWCLLVGYCVRNIEKRLEMTKIFERAESYVESTSE